LTRCRNARSIYQRFGGEFDGTVPERAGNLGAFLGIVRRFLGLPGHFGEFWDMYIALALLVCFPPSVCSTSAYGIGFDAVKRLDQKWLQVIADPSAQQRAVWAAMEKLHDVPSEPPGFWSAIANDPTFTYRRRALCALQLFKRHVRPGMTIGELRHNLDGATWLDVKRVYSCTGVSGGGFIPVDFDYGSDSVFSILPSPEEDDMPFAVYISFRTKINVSELVTILRGQTPNRTRGSIKIRDVHVSFGPPLAGN
jgi:hypothetical protein